MRQPLHLLISMCLLAGILPNHGLHAQSISGLGALSGAVTDASGSAVPNAAVVVVNEALGIRRELLTTSAGIFNALSLTPASNYRVTVSKAGFAPFEVTGVQVTVGQVATVRIPLSVAQTQQSVEVVADLISTDQTKTGVSQVVDSNQILNLPINGRRVDSFVLLTPGVAPEGNFGLLTFRGIPGGNAFLTDGNDTTNQLWNENAGRTASPPTSRKTQCRSSRSSPTTTPRSSGARWVAW